MIVGYDSGSWSSTTAVGNVNNSGRPIVGIETGGANFFSKLSLNIGTNSFSQGATLIPLVSASSIYHSPYQIGMSPTSGQIAVSTNASGWYGYKTMSTIPSGVEALGSGNPTTRIMLSREQSRYLYWPFRHKPDLLTADGKNLFVNSCWYAMR